MFEVIIKAVVLFIAIHIVIEYVRESPMVVVASMLMLVAFYIGRLRGEL